MYDWLENLFYPPRASTLAGGVDKLYTFVVGVTVFFTVLIYILVIVFAVKYRRSKRPRSEQVESSLALELFWSGIPFALAMVIFAWGAVVFWQIHNIPPAANEAEIFVVGKQWMWKIHHPEGPREINKLHVPVGRPVKLVMTSEDVIHSFYIPAFRIKQDVLPGRYTQMWFEATRPGTYHLFCAEYCGTEHAAMIGQIVVMEQADYQEWLRAEQATAPSMASAGAQLYTQLGCQGCHTGQNGASGPPLLGRYNDVVVNLPGGQRYTSEYLRESILDPGVHVTPGYPPIMPTYRGLISEEGLLQITEYLRSGAGVAQAAAPAASQPEGR